MKFSLETTMSAFRCVRASPDPKDPEVRQTEYLLNRADELFCHLASEMVYHTPVPCNDQGDAAYLSLRGIVKELYDQFSPNFEQLRDPSFVKFCTAAFEIFKGESGTIEFSWPRTAALFLLGVCIIKSCPEEVDRANEVCDWMHYAIGRYVIPSIKTSGGWEGILNEYPIKSCTDSNFLQFSTRKRNSLTISVVVPLCLAGLIVYFKNRS